MSFFILVIVPLIWLSGAVLQRVLSRRINRRFRSWPFFLASGLWGLNSCWEVYVRYRWPGANIRPDFLVIYPFLLIVSAIALLLSYRWIIYLVIEGGRVLVGRQTSH